MKAIYFILIILFSIFSLLAQEIVLTGNQESVIRYKLEQSIEPFPDIDVLMVSFVVPQDFHSPTFNQKVSDIQFHFQPAPKHQEEETDRRGNVVRKFYWDAPKQNLQCVVSLRAENSVSLTPIKSEATFPVSNPGGEVEAYLKPSDQVQSGNPAIMKKAQELTKNAATEYQAVQAVLHFVVDHMHYVLVPEQYDALYALKTGKGNCQNYSHLSAALLRAVGIPVRIVNGITLKKAYDVQVGQYEYRFEMAQGRHSWIEVYFSDMGWLPFDPQQSEFFISSRYLRFEVGLDNAETVQDGLVRWSQTSGSAEQMPKLEEAIESEFVTDVVALNSEAKLTGPQKLLLTPPLVSVSTPLAVKEPQPIPEEIPPAAPEPEEIPKEEIDYTALKYEIPFEYGNLDFPRNFDFLYARITGSDGSRTKGELKRNFMVETAEYITSRDQYAQVFVLDEPIRLEKIGLALHSFGGDGYLWLELSEDADGQPGETAAVSRKIPVRRIRTPRGYDWVDFDFSADGLILTPGRYWFTLNYSGSPIVNWFYTYGKPVGPVDGTRSRPRGSGSWDRVLSYEFNYRVLGLGVK